VADQKLFFAHQVMREDCERRPDWEPFMNKWDGRLFTSKGDVPVSSILAMKEDEVRMKKVDEKLWTCPFSFLFTH
jgi:hypothetical protein